jgi:hypothetical protein
MQIRLADGLLISVLRSRGLRDIDWRNETIMQLSFNITIQVQYSTADMQYRAM